MTNWKKIESNIVKFEKEGDSVEGFLAYKEISPVNGNEVYHIKKGDARLVIFGTTVLTSKMATVKIGDEVKIVFIGEQANQNPKFNPVKLFDVFTR